MKIAHEAPISIFDKVQELTDYDYALVHLFEENEQYYDKFVEAKAKGREIILDNSIFELGEAFSGDKFVKWVEKLQPEWYIIPDVLDNCSDTIDSFIDFTTTYNGLPGKAIAVAQGSTFDDYIVCYNFLANHPRVDKIAISFDYPFLYETGDGNKYYRMMRGRQHLINTMIAKGLVATHKKHHLLGCGLPQEFISYQDLPWVDSIDTSNPVIHGMKGIRYKDYGLDDKESVKLHTLINANVVDRWADIEYNIKAFRKFCKG